MATAPAVYVAELDGVLVGMARGAMHEGDVDSSDRWLFSMYVSPIARGSGTAQALIAAVAAWAKSDGGEALCLYHSTDAPRARALYSKVGFVATGKEFQHDERPELRFCEMRMTL
jgi:GNAT superfamily N-acetyltransferase